MTKYYKIYNIKIINLKMESKRLWGKSDFYLEIKKLKWVNLECMDTNVYIFEEDGITKAVTFFDTNFLLVKEFINPELSFDEISRVMEINDHSYVRYHKMAENIIKLQKISQDE